MAIESTNANKPSFFKRVGNFLNKNGNTIGKGMQIAGTTAMGVGVTGMFIDAMNKHSDGSIFGCGCYPYSMMGTGFGGCCSQYSMMNPIMMNPMMMGMGGSIFGCC